MRQRSVLSQAARAVLDGTKQPYVCHQCLAQARTRNFHISASRAADREPAWKRYMKSLIGSKEEDEKSRKRDELLESRSKKADMSENQSMLVDGKEYNVAAYFSTRTHPEYKPATKGSVLESIGSEKWVKKMADQGEQYTSVIPRNQTTLSNAKWQTILRDTITRLLLLASNGHPAEAISRTKGHAWTPSPVSFDIEGDNVTVRFASPEDESQLVAIMNQQLAEQEEADDSVVEAAEDAGVEPEATQGELVPLSDQSWMDVPLDSAMKLAILRRVAQLTGQRVPDLALSKARIVGDIYQALCVKPTPKKLAATEQVKALQIDLPNVTVYNERQTPIHKEQQVGRWKIIVEELERRGLPVTGHRHTGAKIVSTKSPVIKKTKKKFTSKKTLKAKS